MKVNLSLLKRVLFAIGFVIIVGCIVWYISVMTSRASWQHVSTSNPIIQFDAPVKWLVSPLSTDWVEHQTDRQLLTISDGPVSLSPVLITLTVEKGLTFAANLSHQEPMAIVTNAAKLSLPHSFKDFQVLNEQDTTVGGQQARILDFTYTAPTGLTSRERFYFIEHNSDTIIYLQFSTSQDDFAIYNKTYFDHMISSMKFE